jgi:ActR/RegA family two-component response regulator
VRRAAEEAANCDDEVVQPKHLAAPIDDDDSTSRRDSASVDKSRLTRESIERALAANAGNVAATARALDMHRKQLYRLIERFGINVADRK